MIPLPWGKLGVAAAILAAGVGAGRYWESINTARVAQAFSDYRAAQAKALSQASGKALAANIEREDAERRLRQEKEDRENEATVAAATRRADLAGAAAERERLLSALAEARSRADSGQRDEADRTAAVEPGLPPGGATADLRDQLLAGHTGELVEVGGYADDARATALSCVADYEAAERVIRDYNASLR